MSSRLVCRLSDKEVRSLHWLMALTVVLSALLTALEYTVRDDAAYADETLTDDVEAIEMMPVVEMDNAVAVAMPEEPSPAADIEVVDDEVLPDTLPPAPPKEVMDELAADVPPPDEVPATTEGVGTGAAKPLIQLPTDDRIPMRMAEEIPEFPGGQAAFIDWLTKRLHIPQGRQQRGQKHRVVATFTVNADGSVGDIGIVESDLPPFDNEVLRVLRTMPKWKPGKMNSKPCRTVVHLPVVFGT